MIGTAALAAALIQGELESRPNFIVILADDLGYGSLGCYGETEIPTPNIDSLAKNGVRMTDAYVTCPVCSPTRAGLLTGRYQQRFGHEFNPGPQGQASESFGLTKSEAIIPEVLAKNGYRTGMVGKWHLGYEKGFTPMDRGFGSFFGFLGGAHPYFAGQRRSQVMRGRSSVKETEYLTDAFARESVEFIKTDDKSPFFLYLAFNAVHSPLQSTEDYSASFPNLKGKRKTFAGMLTGMDKAVGRVLETLKERKLEENTVIFFLSDNGGPTPQTTSKNGPLRGFKGQVYEGGIRVPFIVQWKGEIMPNKAIPTPCSSLDIFPTILDAAGISKEQGKPVLEGESLIPLIKGDASFRPTRSFFWRFGSQRAVRSGDWKLVAGPGSKSELFNLLDDIGETKDESRNYPRKKAELERLYADWDKKNISPKWRRG